MSDLDYSLLHRVNKTIGLPSFVKQADSSDLTSSDIPVEAYADAKNQRFPCHTAAATWLSGVAFAEKQADYHDTTTKKLICHRILSAAAYFGVQNQVEEAMKKTAENNRKTAPALQDSDYALVMSYSDGTKSRHFPLNNAMAVKKAADYFLKNRFSFKFADRKTIATKILDKATEHGADIGNHLTVLEKSAGYGTCPTKEVSELLKLRARYAKSKQPELADELRKLASTCYNKKSEMLQHPEARVKIAETIDEFDRRYGLVRHYGSSLDAPEDVLFGATFTQVKEAIDDTISTITGNTYRLSDLQRTPISQVRNVLGDELASEISIAGVRPDIEKIAEIVPTLPRSDAELFESILDDVGIQPLPIKQASPRRSFVDMSDIAREHRPREATGLWAYIRR